MRTIKLPMGALFLISLLILEFGVQHLSGDSIIYIEKAYSSEKVAFTPTDHIDSLSFEDLYNELRLHLILVEGKDLSQLIKRLKEEAKKRNSQKAFLLIQLHETRKLFSPKKIRGMEVKYNAIKDQLLESGDRFLIANFYYFRGLLDSFIYNDELKAIKNFQKALSLYDANDKNLEQYLPMYSLAESYRVSGQEQKTIATALRGLEILQGTGLRNQQSQFYEVLGNAYLELGQYAKAMDSHFKAYSFYKEKNRFKDQVYSLFSIASIKDTLGDHDAALTYYKQAISLFAKTEISDKKKAQIYYNISNTYASLNRLEDAQSAVQESLKISERNKDYNEIVFTKLRLAEIKITQGKPRTAIELIESLEKINEKYWSTFSKTRRMNHLSRAYFQLKDYQTAESFLLKSIEMGEKHDTPHNLMGIYQFSIEFYETIGDIKRLHDVYKRSKNIEIELLKESNKKLLYAKEIEFKNNENEILEKENQIKDLQLKQKDTETKFLIIILVFVIISFTSVFSLAYNSVKKSKLIQAERLNTEIRTRSLHEQMQPHFLFNALNTIIDLIQVSSEKASDALQMLSDLYQDILRGSKYYTWPLNDELGLIRSYLNLQQLRFGDKLKYTIDYEDIDIDSMHCPCLMLHTLVENSIKHATSRNPKGGAISILLKQRSDGLNVIIQDTGPGDSAPSNMGKALGTKTGLANTKKRLENMYGDRSAFKSTFSKNGSEISFWLSGKPLKWGPGIEDNLGSLTNK